MISHSLFKQYTCDMLICGRVVVDLIHYCQRGGCDSDYFIKAAALLECIIYFCMVDIFKIQSKFQNRIPLRGNKNFYLYIHFIFNSIIFN